jgi:hypothetical protein
MIQRDPDNGGNPNNAGGVIVTLADVGFRPKPEPEHYGDTAIIARQCPGHLV